MFLAIVRTVLYRGTALVDEVVVAESVIDVLIMVNVYLVAVIFLVVSSTARLVADIITANQSSIVVVV